MHLVLVADIPVGECSRRVSTCRRATSAVRAAIRVLRDMRGSCQSDRARGLCRNDKTAARIVVRVKCNSPAVGAGARRAIRVGLRWDRKEGKTGRPDVERWRKASPLVLRSSTGREQISCFFIDRLVFFERQLLASSQVRACGSAPACRQAYRRPSSLPIRRSRGSPAARCRCAGCTSRCRSASSPRRAGARRGG